MHDKGVHEALYQNNIMTANCIQQPHLLYSRKKSSIVKHSNDVKFSLSTININVVSLSLKATRLLSRNFSLFFL